MKNTLKIGDILRCSWGYDQTNIDFYEVVKATEKTVTIVAIESEESRDGATMTGVSVPRPGKVKKGYGGNPEMPMRRTFRLDYNNEPYVNIESYSIARLFKPAIVAGIKVFAPSNFSFYG